MEHRPPPRHNGAIGLDWAVDLVPQADQMATAADMLILLAERLRQLAVAAQTHEALSTTQIRLLLLLARHPGGLSPTRAAQQLARSLPVTLEASGILLQRRLIARCRFGQGARYVLQITEPGLSVARRLGNWSSWLNTKMQACETEDLVAMTRVIDLVVTREYQQ